MNNKYSKAVIKIFLCLLQFQLLNSQIIKIFVLDAETRKQIPNAKVFLEGIGIPSLNAKYNSKEGYYYFDEHSEKYNTIMVYHKKYNEKGFQNKNNLPQEITFKLHKSLNNYYDFVDKKNSSKDHIFYVEDPYKIIIRPESSDISYNSFREKIYSFIKKNNLEIEPINPSIEYNIRKGYKNQLVTEPYPLMFSENITCNQNVCSFPLIYGFDNFQTYCNDEKTTKTKNIVLFFRKKDKTKFKRFNDPIINKIEESRQFKILYVIYNKGIRYIDDLNSNYNYRDRENRNYNIKNKIDSSAVYFYNNDLPLNKRKVKHSITDEKPSCEPIFTLVEKNNCYPLYISELFYEKPPCLLINWEKENNDFDNPKFFPGLGLGILDIFEYYQK